LHNRAKSFHSFPNLSWQLPRQGGGICVEASFGERQSRDIRVAVNFDPAWPRGRQADLLPTAVSTLSALTHITSRPVA
jgi:hypothetical protein